MVVAKLNGNWGVYLDYNISTVSQSKPNNNSVIRVSVSIGTPYAISWSSTGRSVNISVAGQSKSLGVGNLNLNNSRQSLGSVDFTIGHNSTGDATANVSLSVDLGNVAYGSWRAGSLSTSYSYPLAKIIRQSTFSLSTSNVNTGSAVTVNISRADGSYTHTIKYRIGSASGNIATGVATSYAWTVPTSLNSQMPNSTSLTGTIIVDTYSGSTLIGSNQINITINVPSNIVPSFTGVTLTDSNTNVQKLIPEANYYVQILSNINVKFNGATGNSGSTISGYYAEIKGKGQVITSDNTTLGLMNYSGSIVISAKVQDSRGRWSAVKDTTVTVLAYHPPVLSFSVQRTGGARNTLTVTRNVSIAPLTIGTTNRNLGTLYFRVSPANAESYGAEINKQDTNSLTNSNANLVGTFAGNSAWKVKAFLVDKLTTTPITAVESVSTEKVVYYYDENGFAVGKIREKYMFETAGDISIPTNNVYRRGDNEIQNLLLVPNDGRTIYAYDTDVNLQQSTGLRWINPGCANSPFPNNYGFIVTFRATVDWLQYGYRYASPKGGTFVRFGSRKSDTNPINWSEWEDISYQKPPRSDIIQRDVKLPYGMKGKLIRQGNLVTLSVERNPITLDTAAEYAKMNEKIPDGFKPTTQTTMIIIHNASTTFYPNSKMYLETNGEIRMTWNHSSYSIATGTVTYITSDPYP